jgi:hypothetical protein
MYNFFTLAFFNVANAANFNVASTIFNSVYKNYPNPNDFRDITMTTCGLLSAGSGYDLCTGVGSSLTYQGSVTKQTPNIVWPTPDDITYGTALSVTQLNAVAGTYTYTPPSGTVINAGHDYMYSTSNGKR